jgi:hypothetical protein
MYLVIRCCSKCILATFVIVVAIAPFAFAQIAMLFQQPVRPLLCLIHPYFVALVSCCCVRKGANKARLDNGILSG